MIVEAFVGALRAVLDTILGLIPASGDLGGSDIDPALFAYKMPPVRWASSFLPISHIVAAIGVISAWWAACTIYRIVIWALGALHIIGGDS